MKDKKQRKAEECFRKRTQNKKKTACFSKNSQQQIKASAALVIASVVERTLSITLFRIFKWEMFMTVDVECLIRILISTLLLLLPRIS